jgi:hypothetical protein
VRTVPKSNKNHKNRGTIDTPNTHKNSLSWLGTGTPIKRGRVNLVLILVLKQLLIIPVLKQLLIIPVLKQLLIIPVLKQLLIIPILVSILVLLVVVS